MKFRQVLLVLLLLISLSLVSVPFNPQSNISEDNTTLSYDKIIDDQKSEDNFGVTSISPNTEEKIETSQIENRKFGDYNIKKWSSISHLFPSFDYSGDAKIAITDNNELRVITLENHLLNSKISLEQNLPGFEVLKTESPQINYAPISLGHIDLNQLQAGGIDAIKFNQMKNLFEPDFVIETDYTANDPGILSQWAVPTLDLPSAWDINLGNKSVKVAVLDTGIDYNHPDLSANYLSIGYDWVNNDADPMDDQYHGTHVAGTIAAGINNGIGVAGVANVSIFAEKILDSSGSGAYSWAIDAIHHAVDQGADILSNSWGGSGFSQALQDAVNYADANDVAFIAAAGNDATSDPHYPAALDNVISVASVTSTLEQSSFSNFGNTIDIAAPGSSINSTLPGNTYGMLSGTSMATPHVSGIAALFLSEFPDLTADELENVLYISAQDLGDVGYDTIFGYGLAMPDLTLSGLPIVDLTPKVVQETFDANLQERSFRIFVTNFGSSAVSDVDVTTYLDNQIIDQRSISSIDRISSQNFTLTVSEQSTQDTNLTVIVNEHVDETGDMINYDTVILREMDILNEDDVFNQEGAFILIDAEFEGSSDLNSLSYLRNGVEIMSFVPTGLNDQFYLPLEQNGTTQIELVASWVDGSFFEYHFTIEAVNVIPLIDFDVGDVFDWTYVEGNLNQKQQFTINSFVSPDTVNMTIFVENSEEGTVTGSFYLWGLVNIYSTMYELTNFGWDGLRFSLVTNLEKGDLQKDQYHLGFLSWQSVLRVDTIRADVNDQMIVTSIIPGTSSTFEYYMPQKVAKSRNETTSGYMTSTTELDRDEQGLSIFADTSSYSLSERDYVEVNITNTGDYVEHINNLQYMLNNLELPYTIEGISLEGLQENDSQLMPGFTYQFQAEVVGLSNDLNFMITTLSNSSTHNYSFEGVIEVVDDVYPTISTTDLLENEITIEENLELNIKITERFFANLTIKINDEISMTYSVDDHFGEFSYDFNPPEIGLYNITFTVTDTSGNSGNMTFQVNVVEVINDPPSSQEPTSDTTPTSNSTPPSDSSATETEDQPFEFDLNFPVALSIFGLFGLHILHRKKEAMNK